MGLETSRQFSDWGVLTGRKAWLALLAALAIALGAANAETTTGLVIEQDGNQVNVRYNPEALANFDITRRGDDTTIIRIPNARDGATPFSLLVDPRLKSGNIVRESETSQGRVITIHSQQVDTLSQDDLNGPLLANNPAPASKAKPAIAPAAKTASPSTPKSTTTNAMPTTQAAAGKPQSKADIRQPVSTKTSSATTGAAKAKTSPQATQSNAADAVKKADSAQPETTGKSPVKDSAAQKAQAPAVAASSNTAKPEDDPEMLPLNLSGDTQKQADNAATGMMLRATISLLAVLALLFVFMRRVLPELMNRYPRFFENLRRREQAPQSQALPGRSPILGLPRPFSGALETDFPDEQAFDAIVKNSHTRVQPPMNRPSSQKQLLTHFGQEDEQFHVLTSTPLGKGRELHLVEIQGRQLVLATTPYTVSLIKDLSEPATLPDEAVGQPDEPRETESIHPLLMTHSTPITSPLDEAAVENGRHSPDRHSIPTPSEKPAALPSLPKKSNVHAYLEDDPALMEARRPRTKPFASKVPLPELSQDKAPRSPGRQAMENNSGNPNPLDRLYMKYLSPEELNAERERAQSQRRSVSANLESLLAEERQNAGIIDAEEVVILEDYDDTYDH